MLVAAVIVALVRYLPAYQSLQRGRTDVLGAESILRGAGLDLTADQLATATALLNSAKQDFGQRSSVIDHGWIAGAMASLPWVDRRVAAVRALRHAGEDGTKLRARPHPGAPGAAQQFHRWRLRRRIASLVLLPAARRRPR